MASPTRLPLAEVKTFRTYLRAEGLAFEASMEGKPLALALLTAPLAMIRMTWRAYRFGHQLRLPLKTMRRVAQGLIDEVDAEVDRGG